jgi:hypothetical protein
MMASSFYYIVCYVICLSSLNFHSVITMDEVLLKNHLLLRQLWTTYAEFLHTTHFIVINRIPGTLTGLNTYTSLKVDPASAGLKYKIINLENGLYIRD